MSKAGGFFRREVFRNPNGFGGCCDGYIPSLKLTAQIAPENGPFNPKGNFIIFQPLEFPGAFAVSFREDIYIYTVFLNQTSNPVGFQNSVFFPLQHIWGETNVKNNNFFFRSFFSGDLGTLTSFFSPPQVGNRLESLNCPQKLGWMLVSKVQSPKQNTSSPKNKAKQIITNF